MFRLFTRNKLAIALVVVVFLSAIIFIVSGITVTNSRKLQFPLDGYAIQYEDGTDTGVVADQVRFASGSAVSSSTIESASFLHFDNNSLSSLDGMTLVDLDDYADGLADSYYLGSRQILSSQDGVYGIDNNGSPLEFENFVLKTDEQTYLMISPSISLEQKNGQINNVADGFMEIKYLDDDNLAVRATNGSEAWQFMTDGAVVTLDNGVMLDLPTKQLQSGVTDEDTGEYTATMSLASVGADVDTTIQVTNHTADAWVEPVFVVNPVNGSDGVSGVQGDDGESGEAGEDGEDGTNGETGATGEDAADGTHGANATNGSFGGNGQDGVNASADDDELDDDDGTDIKLAPCITISSWTQTAGSFAFSFVPYNTSMIDSGTLKAVLYNSSTGNEIYRWSETDLTVGAELKSGTEYTPGTSQISLDPETGYKLVFQAQIMKTTSSDGVTVTQKTYGKSILLSRTFTTDANGFYLEKVDSEYFASFEDRWACQNRYKDSMATLGISRLDSLDMGGFLGLRPVVSGGQQITGFSNVKITYRDDDGQVVESTAQRLSDPNTSTQECANLVELVNQGLVYPLDNLLSDTEYTISMTVEIDGTKKEQFSETYTTLKATPEVCYGCFTVNAGGYFESYVDFAQKDDPDDAIAYYTHKVYAWDDNTKMLGAVCLKTKISYNTGDPKVNIYLESTNQKDTGKITANTDYGTRIYVTWFDNEKYVTKELDYSSSWKPAKIDLSTQSKVVLTNMSVTSTTMKAKLVVVPNGNKTVSVGGDDIHRLLVQISSSNKTDILYYTDLSQWQDRLDGASLDTRDNIIPSSGGYTWLELSNLAPGTRYTVTVTGILDESKTADSGSDDGSDDNLSAQAGADVSQTVVSSQKVQIGSATFITETANVQTD